MIIKMMCSSERYREKKEEQETNTGWRRQFNPKKRKRTDLLSN